MSILRRDPALPRMTFRRVTRMAWGPDPRRVVMVALVEIEGVKTATVWGVQDGSVVQLASQPADKVERRGTGVAVVLADGSEWVTNPVGCSCNVPGPLRGFNPLRAA